MHEYRAGGVGWAGDDGCSWLWCCFKHKSLSVGVGSRVKCLFFVRQGRGSENSREPNGKKNKYIYIYIFFNIYIYICTGCQRLLK